MTRPRQTLRKLAFGLIPAIVLLASLELISLHHYFRDIRPEALGIKAATHDLREALLRRFSPESAVKHNVPPNVEIFEALYSDQGTALLTDLQRQYEESFVQLAGAIEQIGALLFVVYIPPTVEHPLAPHVAEVDARFFQRLATEAQAHYLDFGPTMAIHALEDTAFWPHNLHLSRFGNRLLASAVAAEVEDFTDFRSPHRFDHHPQLLGDLPPNTARIWQDINLPFRATINAQGLRMTDDVVPRSEAQRILLLGDSFTFGYNVHDIATYPYLLGQQLQQHQIINAGVPGYTITQELEMFLERSRYTEPDIVVLQVLFNDLFGLLSFERNIFSRDLRTRGFWFGKRIPGRERQAFKPSALEREFFDSLAVAVD